MSEPLAERKCRPCEGGVEPLTAGQIDDLRSALHADWAFAAKPALICRRFSFVNFSRTMGFANAVAWISMTEGHHPEMKLGYDYCEVAYRTWAIDGLSDNDFICAAKVDRLAAGAS